MQKFFLFIACICMAGALRSQNLVASTYLGSKTKNQLIAQFGVPFIQYDVKYYKIRYSSVDAAGLPDTLSGLLVVPVKPETVFPLLVYQHGTSDCKTCVPSRYGSPGGGEGDAGLVFGGMGYIAILPDYVGMGDGRGFHPYVHAATEASAAIDMIRSIKQWLNSNAPGGGSTQLFITGYSQGGHGAMALFREIETHLTNEFTVTSAAPCSGPYSISGVMRDLILSQEVYYYPAYIPNTALSYQTVYGNLYNNLTDIFKPEYAGFIQQYYDGQISLSTLNESLIQTLTTLTGASVARRMLQESAIAAVENDPNHPINLALKDNDVFNWTPVSPTRIFYCTADDQVPFRNSVVARDTMTANGAADLQAIDVNPTADHGGCVVPALTQTLFFFAQRQEIINLVDGKEPAAALHVQAGPNPANNTLFVNGLKEKSSITLTNWEGKEVYATRHTSGPVLQLSVGDLPQGIYVLKVVQTDGKMGVRQVVVGH